MAKCTEHRHEKNFGARRLPGNAGAHAKNRDTETKGEGRGGGGLREREKGERGRRAGETERLEHEERQRDITV